VSELDFPALERVYERLAKAIDRAGPTSEAVFLTRLALVLAHRCGDEALVHAAITTALQAAGPADGVDDGLALPVSAI